jgi:hypothetical protein
MANHMTREQAQAIRAVLTAKQAQQPFDRKAWIRARMRQERARRKAVGLCLHCGQNLVEKFAWCTECREKDSLRHQARAQRRRQQQRTEAA